jgi:hypothetical protein
MENWEAEARKILAVQNLSEAEIEQAIEAARAAPKASEEGQAGTLQIIPLSAENWEAEVRELLSKANPSKSKEEIDAVIEDARKKMENPYVP